MTITPLEIYLILKADVLLGVIGLFAILITILSIAIIVGYFLNLIELNAKVKNADSDFAHMKKSTLYTKVEIDLREQRLQELEKELKEWKNLGKRLLKWPILASLFFIISYIVIPDTKTLAAMYIIPQLSQSDVLQKLPQELQSYIESVIKNQSP